LPNDSSLQDDKRSSVPAEEDAILTQLRFILFSWEKKKKAPARLVRNVSLLQGALQVHQVHQAQQSPRQSVLAAKQLRSPSVSEDSLASAAPNNSFWTSSPIALRNTAAKGRIVIGSGSFPLSPKASQRPVSPSNSSSSIPVRVSTNDKFDTDESFTQCDDDDDVDDVDDVESEDEEKSSKELSLEPVRVAEDSLGFFNMDVEETAKQLTLIDSQLFRGIPKKELLNKRFMNPDTSPNFNAMVNRFNQAASWVGSVILAYEQPSRRAKAICRFIKICTASLRLNSFNTVFAILAGLNNTAISRLKLTWERVPRKYMRRFKELMGLVSDGKNHSTYRQELLKARPPIVPYLALFSRDLFGVEESNSTITPDGLINFAKMRMICKLINEFASFQVSFPFEIEPTLRSLLKGFQPPSEDEQYERSHRLEPRKCS